MIQYDMIWSILVYIYIWYNDSYNRRGFGIVLELGHLPCLILISSNPGSLWPLESLEALRLVQTCHSWKFHSNKQKGWHFWEVRLWACNSPLFWGWPNWELFLGYLTRQVRIHSEYLEFLVSTNMNRTWWFIWIPKTYRISCPVFHRWCFPASFHILSGVSSPNWSIIGVLPSTIDDNTLW